MMWQIICADGVITEFEDNLVWRAADLLGISRNERIALRERVMGGAGAAGDDAPHIPFVPAQAGTQFFFDSHS